MGKILLQHASNVSDPSDTTPSPLDGKGYRHSSQQKSGWLASLLWTMLLVAAFGSGWFAATHHLSQSVKEAMPEDTAHPAAGTSVVAVTAEPVSIQKVQRTVEAFGTLYGFEDVSISARVEGRVRKVLHDVADNLQPTEPLLEIDPTDYELTVQQSDRALQVELAKLGLKSPPDSRFDLEKVPFVAKARSQMDHAKTRLERISRLAASKTISAEESENAASDYKIASAEYENQILQAETDLATIQMKQVGLEVAREQLANTKVLTPTPSIAVPGIENVSYVVSQRSVSEGTVVRPGTEIFRVVINQILKLRVPVPERYSVDVQLGQQAEVFVATSRTPFTGTVTRVYPVVDPATRTFQVEIQVPNLNGELKPGSFAKAAILTRVDSNAVTVPLASVIQFAGITKIFLVENGHATEVPVVLGTQTTEWVEIAEPQLSENALVVTSGQSAIARETAVTVRTHEQ
jgi:RND family efflux transporter MFP subunit